MENPPVVCSFCGTASGGSPLTLGRDGHICRLCAVDALDRLLRRTATTPLWLGDRPCSFCGVVDTPARRTDAANACICGDCLLACAGQVVARPRDPVQTPHRAPVRVNALLRAHFAGHELAALASYVRVFPVRMRPDVETGVLAALRAEGVEGQPIGVRRRHDHGTIDLPSIVTSDEHDPVVVAPLQHVDVDIGEGEPRRCTANGIWLFQAGELPIALLLVNSREYGEATGLHIEVAALAGPEGAAFARRFFGEVENAVRGSRAYRGKVLSLEEPRQHFRGQSTAIRVHRLRNVAREDVVLPEETLATLERNTLGFHAKREGLRRLGLSLKKGLLLHGPPGTGKTHCIQWLIGALEGHTTLLVTGEQVGLIGEYMALARLLEPSIVVIEDADLVAGDRGGAGPCEEVLLNKLLNEMDGLREDAAILFLLTTNRPDALEPALASRPGRIDQAIAFPLPDEIGRRKLVSLYARGLDLSEALRDELARRTEGVSASFIKELLRRTAQASLEGGSARGVTSAHVVEALDEMLRNRGDLGSRLVGAG